ncbi:hypothetical protein HN011_007438 [Eciton burchellii]|nr:hypothetical protein HN011_007438 [Eciton burchellii]
MICLEAEYFNVNRILLQAIGSWPFQQSKFAEFQYIIILITLVSVILCQITTFLTTELTPKFAFRVLSCVFFFIMLLISYILFHIKIETMRDLMKQLHYTCTELKNKSEIAIIYKYGCDAKRYTTILTILFLGGSFLGISSQIVIAFSSTISLTNISRLRQVHIPTEYFIDEEKYFSFILLHINAAIIIGIFAIIAMGTLMMAYLQHTCAMFRIACYRIEHAMEINVLKNINSNGIALILKNIVHAINIHRKAMKLSELITSRFDTPYFCLTIILVIALTLNLFQIFLIVISHDDVMKLSLPMAMVTTLTMLMFLTNYIGQNVTDHNNEVYTAAYNIQWYICSQRIQKSILLVLQRGAKNFHLSCGGLFIASFECFAMLVKTTMSYFTVMYSIINDK